MGSVRRQLVLGFVLLPNPVLAEVCDKVLPDWDGAQIDAIHEALGFWTSPAAIPFVAMVIAAIWMKSRALVSLAITLGILTLLYKGGFGSDILDAARLEGCRGPLWLLTLTLLAPTILLLRKRA